MTAVLVALAAGMAVGLAGLDRRIPPAWWDAASRWTLRVLLVCMGLRLGLDPQVGAGLVQLGGRAAAFAVATAGGSLLAGLLGAALLGSTRGRATVRDAARQQPARACPRGNHSTSAGENDRHPALEGAPAVEGAPPHDGHAGEALRLSAAAVVAVAGGWLAGILFLHATGAGWQGRAPVPAAAAAAQLATTGSGYALVLLMALYGREFGCRWPDTRASLRRIRGQALVLPVVGGLGSLAGGWVAGRLAGEPTALALAVAAAFGWYSMAGVLVVQLWDPAAGALAFLANVLRELLTVVAVPFLVKVARHRAWLAVLPGGATTMDTTLPVIAAAAGDAGTTALAFVHGLVLTLLAPTLITWFSRF
ncbi:protein of unknown function DUF340 membrane [Thermaerobacter marianensis DSM 12885]|uniref:Lysine exporter LysO family protein n=1 Tax=Thermaerobacter marianensis (strain ATCC 700841 / DSM 12885 / JCM 10246 / 7p75a) TaxID=644966 RepID=E6SJ35_THEM7|nr:lysine exporter LysO family protein [Thermaerobacter marianensis]ADU52059.1 protein of unknown function DUF340 membrane [Thermaerobacter marianensis DSM 12885]